MTPSKTNVKLRCERINVEEAIFLSCDQQESFSKIINEFETIIGAGKQLIKIANLLNIPILVTEQNPQRFGHVANELSRELPLVNCAKFTKSTFSMVNSDTIEFLNRYPHRKTAVLFGGETQVCILQTFQDLVDLGYTVYLVVDAISSSRVLDRSAALHRMGASGGIFTTSESVIFELLRTAAHPLFKKALQIIKMDRVNAISKL